MKKYILSLFIVSILSIGYVQAYEEYWGDNNNYWNGKPIRESMAEFPNLTESRVDVANILVSGNQQTVSFSVNMSWFNFRRRAATSAFQRAYTIKSFVYSYKIGYALSPNGNVSKWLFESGIINLSDISMIEPDVPVSNRKYASSQNKHSINVSQNIDVSSIPFDSQCYIVIILSIKPSIIWDPMINNSTEQEGVAIQDNPLYTRIQNLEIRKNVVGNTVCFMRTQSTMPIINYNSMSNPRFRTGVYERNIVYDHPNAILAVKLDTANLQATKIIGTKKYYAYSTCLAGVGPSEPPMIGEYIFHLPSNDCWSKHCDGIEQSDYIEYLNDNPEEKQYLQNSIGLSDSRRFKNKKLIECSKNDGNYDKAILSLYDDGLSDAFGYSINTDKSIWVEWNYRLRDIVKESKTGNVSGAVFSIRNANMYKEATTHIQLLKDKAFTHMGYEQYGPNYGSSFYNICASALYFPKSNNILSFEVVPKVKFKPFEESEKQIRKQCVTPTVSVEDNLLITEEDLIILRGKEVDFGAYSSSIYAPEYLWEISTDTHNWQILNSKSSFANYIKYAQDYDFGIVLDDDKDLLLSSTILKNRDKLYFRPVCVLRTFSNAQRDDLYNYQGDNYLYYIKITSNDYYTYAPYSILNNENISIGSFPEKQYVCYGEQPIMKEFSFNLVKSSKVEQEEIDQIKSIAKYVIYKVDKDKETFISSKNEYTIPYVGDSLHYRCVISIGHNSFYKEIFIYANPQGTIRKNKIESDAQIASIDEDNEIVTMLALRSKDVNLILNDENINETDFYVRNVVPYVTPQLNSTDFSTLSRTQCEQYISDKNWNFAEETGNKIDDVPVSYIRSWCTNKEKLENDNLIQQSKLDYITLNEWRLFDKENTTILKNYTNDNSDALFYIRKRQAHNYCYSDSVRLRVKYFNGIKDNIISFSKASDMEKSNIYMTTGEDSPTILGLTVSGGYGVPEEETNNYSYLYQWIYRAQGGIWQKLSEYTDNGKGTASSSRVSLAQGKLIIDRPIDIARIVMSRAGGDVTTQVRDTSNILSLYIENPIDETGINVINDGKCAGTYVDVEIAENLEDSKNTIYRWRTDDLGITIKSYGDNTQNICSFYNSKHDFIISVYRENILNGSRTADVNIPISVISMVPDFSITVDGVESEILEYPDEYFVVQPGARIQLNNQTQNADKYLWTLELQYHRGCEIKGTTSYIENPVCYLYNTGQNKIRLTATNKEGCVGSITAENIYVSNSSSHSINDVSFFANEIEDQKLKASSELCITANPTILSDEDYVLYLKTNLKNYSYKIVDLIGRILLSGYSDSENQELDLSGLQSGGYLLNIEGNIIRIVKK
ncbi:MAG: hypothetical protein EOL95_00730 [Bacteroidia bacterium]|nr:hypothetical protein [Bacteroidia bacterium]